MWFYDRSATTESDIVKAAVTEKKEERNDRHGASEHDDHGVRSGFWATMADTPLTIS